MGKDEFDDDDDYSLKRFDTFICYRESDESKRFAIFIKKLLFKLFSLNAFVAHKPRNTYSADFDRLREKIIEDCKFFIFINSEGAFDSSEIKKEFRMAKPHLESDTLKLIVLRHKSPNVKYTNELFELETGVKLGVDNQASFSNESDLFDVVPDVFNNEKYSPYLNKTRAMRLKDYLESRIAAVNKKDLVDNKSIKEIFVWNKALSTSTKYWNTNEQEIPISETEDWTVHKFLNGSERYVLVGASFGIGKTSYSLMLAADMAKKYLTEFNSFIPIYVPLRDHFHNIDDNGNDFQNILSLVPNDQSKILFIIDGIDEYGEEQEITQLYNSRVEPYLKGYPNSKFLLTTRLKAGLPQHFHINQYVRLYSFSTKQVDEFMSKYGVDLRVSAINLAGLSSDESGKGLFCRMIAIIYKRKKTLQFGKDIKVNRTLLYHEFIHNIILGKDRQFSKNYDYERHYLSEKKALRKIAELKYIYEDSLTIKGIEESIVNFDSDIREHFSELFDRLVSAYFYIKDTHSYEKRIDFIHRSFIEYLVAEFYLESCLNDQMSNVNKSTLSSETISFMEGLLYIIKSDSSDTDMYFNQIMESFGYDNITKSEIRDKLIKFGEKSFESEILPLPDSKYFPQTKDIVFYKNLQNHRWIGILLLNKLGDNYKINSGEFFRFIKSTNKSNLGYIITIENLDLSNSHIEGGLGDYNLSGAKLPHSTFHGKFFGTMFVDADLSQSKIKVGTTFQGSDFSKANMSGLKVEIKGEVSPFIVHFINCIFNECDMTGVDLDDTSFTLSKFHKTNLSGAKLGYADISLIDITDVTINDDTDTRDVNLLSKGFYFEWEDIRGNKGLIKAILNDFDPNNLDPKIKAKILHDNPEYQ